MRKKSFWLLEILIWFILLMGLISLGINFGKDYLTNRKSYNVFFKDVDGLIVGSPVRLMGIQVGHITRIDILDDKVNVTFVVTDSNVNIPAGSTINVQFTGLAGSKSLEIQPHQTYRHGQSFFEVQEPIRIHSIINVQSDIARSVLDCSKLALSFLGNGGVEEIKENIEESKLITKKIDYTLIDTSRSLRVSKAKMAANSKDIQQYLNKGTSCVDDFNNEEFKYPSTTKQSLVSILDNINNTDKMLENEEFSKYKDKTLHNLKNINHKINKFHKNIEYMQSPKPDYLDNLYNFMNTFIDGCFNASNFLQNTFEKKNIHEIHAKVKNIKKQTADTEQNL